MAQTGKIEIVVKGKDDGASAALDKIGKSGEEMGKKLDKASKALMVGGMAIVGALTAAAKAAEDERINIARLSQVLENVGVAYDDVSESLEANILATQRKTGMADDAQRNALSELIIATGDYKTALDLLPLALDFAAAKQMDVSASAELIGKVAAGNISMLTRYGIVLGENATVAEALDAVQLKVVGSAEAMASPLEVMKAAFGDLTESLGAAVLPTFEKVVDVMTSLIDKFKTWVDDNPGVINAILKIGAALIAFSVAIKIVNVGLAITKALSGPTGWATLAAGLVVAGVAVAGMNKLMGSGTANSQSENDAMYEQVMSGAMTSQDFIKAGGKVPGSYASGGTVPGPMGAPVPIIAHGGEQFLGAGGRGGGGGLTVNIGSMLGDEASLRSFSRKIKQMINEDNRRTVFPQINGTYRRSSI